MANRKSQIANSKWQIADGQMGEIGKSEEVTLKA
jgi:hypothetical protein